MCGRTHLEFLHLPLGSVHLFLTGFALILVESELLLAVVFIMGQKLLLARFSANFDVVTLSADNVDGVYYFLAFLDLCYFLENLRGKIFFAS